MVCANAHFRAVSREAARFFVFTMLRLEAAPREKPSAKQMRRERLTQRERKKFRRIYTTGQCEVTGIQDTRNTKHDIHHIRPVFAGGRKTIKNLAYIEPKTHKKIHQDAKRTSKKKDLPEGDITDDITRQAIQIGKWGRYNNGEDPQDIYKREIMIEKRKQLVQQEMFREGTAEG